VWAGKPGKECLAELAIKWVKEIILKWILTDPEGCSARARSILDQPLHIYTQEIGLN
jgi:hypothetical protein